MQFLLRKCYCLLLSLLIPTEYCQAPKNRKQYLYTGDILFFTQSVNSDRANKAFFETEERRLLAHSNIFKAK